MSNIIFNNGVKFPSLIIPTGSQPLDSRTIVQNLPLYSCEFTEGAVYLGMPVSCLADNNFYTLKSISTDKFTVVTYKGKLEILSEVEKLPEYQSLSANDKEAITDTKIENVNKLEWQQVGKETVLPDGTLSGYLDGVTSYTGIGEDGTTPTYTGVPYTISYSDGKVTGFALDMGDIIRKKYVDDKVDALAYNVNYTITNLDVNDEVQNGQYVAYVSQADGKISVGRATLPTLSDLGGITPSAVDTKISNAINDLDSKIELNSGEYLTGITQEDGKITSYTYTTLPDLKPYATKVELNTAIGNLDASYTAGEGQYISAITQVDGKISATYATLPTTTDGKISYGLGISYGWNNTAYTPTYTSIPMIITYANGAITNIDVRGLGSVASKDYVDGKISYEISNLPEIESATIVGTQEDGIIYTYTDTVTGAPAKLTISTNAGKISEVKFNNLGNLVTKEYVDHMHNVLLGDNKLKDTVDTITEISYWLDNNPNDAVELTLSLAELTEKVNDNEKVVATSINTINSKLTWGVI